jgi:hypothetical protein
MNTEKKQARCWKLEDLNGLARILKRQARSQKNTIHQDVLNVAEAASCRSGLIKLKSWVSMT